MPPQSHKGLYILLILILICALGSFAFIAYSFLSSRTSTGNSLSLGSGGFFDNQTAMVNGKITTSSGNMVTVQNKQGATQQFMTSKNLFINDPSNPPSASHSAQTLQILTNKDALINFIYTNNGFEVSSITYVPSGNLRGGAGAPPLPASNSAVAPPQGAPPFPSTQK